MREQKVFKEGEWAIEVVRRFQRFKNLMRICLILSVDSDQKINEDPIFLYLYSVFYKTNFLFCFLVMEAVNAIAESFKGKLWGLSFANRVGETTKLDNVYKQGENEWLLSEIAPHALPVSRN